MGKAEMLRVLEETQEAVVPPKKAVAWGCEVIKCLTRAQRETSDTRQHFIKAMGHHAELVAQFEELKAR
ncbi:hypothetical protein F511_44757 [Dorcoceras hygrometricum]|uniref:Uncharacterized protein n=1 Tax=Dorcoceras hygrometricum TaxID=472368 RepID=A0A2Z6ZXD1_9LAMI|nr:hypothetical protein F511_44757 [Dorcoceras hygrometricum]